MQLHILHKYCLARVWYSGVCADSTPGLRYSLSGYIVIYLVAYSRIYLIAALNYSSKLSLDLISCNELNIYI